MQEEKRTSDSLRKLLFEQIEGVRNGTIDVAVARTIAVLAGTILKSVEVEIQFKRQINETKEPMLIGDLELAEASKPAPDSTPRLIPGKAQSGSRP